MFAAIRSPCLFLCLEDKTLRLELPIPTTRLETFPAPHGAFLVMKAQGDFGCWRASLPGSERSGNIQVCVRYAGLNFRDVMIGYGKIDPTEALLGYSQSGGGFGLEFAGTSFSGSMKVMGLGRDCITNSLNNQPRRLVWELPAKADLEDFATVPCAYATAYYALCVRGKMRGTDSVLLHCGTGGVGQVTTPHSLNTLLALNRITRYFLTYTTCSGSTAHLP